MKVTEKRYVFNTDLTKWEKTQDIKHNKEKLIGWPQTAIKIFDNIVNT